MGFYEKHIFVCENVRAEGQRVSCGPKRAKEIRELLKLKVKERFSGKKIRVNMSGCLDRCELGPVQVSYPEGIWFSIKNEEDIEKFLNHYLANEDQEKIQDILLEK